MNRHELDHHIQSLLTSHGEVFAALRRANAKMGDAIAAHDEAISLAIEANQAALRVLRAIHEDDPQ
jgi:hypothetical protein